MRILDYFFKNYVEDALDTLSELGMNIANVLLVVFCYITIPLWIVPYMLWKKKGK